MAEGLLILALLQRWALLSVGVYVSLWLMVWISRARTVPDVWYPFVIGAILTAASWAWRCGG